MLRRLEGEKANGTRLGRLMRSNWTGKRPAARSASASAGRLLVERNYSLAAPLEPPRRRLDGAGGAPNSLFCAQRAVCSVKNLPVAGGGEQQQCAGHHAKMSAAAWLGRGGAAPPGSSCAAAAIFRWPAAIRSGRQKERRARSAKVCPDRSGAASKLRRKAAASPPTRSAVRTGNWRQRRRRRQQ